MSQPRIAREVRDEGRRRALEGESPYAIARDLGVSRSVVYQWAWPERYGESLRREAKRAWEHAHDRGTCPCGAATTIGAKRQGVIHCAACEREMRKVGRAMREERIAALWLDGLSLKDIAIAIGSPGLQIGPFLAQMRAKGWDLPYRRAGWVPGTNTQR